MPVFNKRKPRVANQDDFWDSARRNRMEYIHYEDRLTELSISMFEWKNLPDSIDERFMELVLFGDGCCVFFEDEVMGYLALQVMIGGKLNVYRIPTVRKAYATNGYNKELDETNSVIIYNNMIHTNSWPVVVQFAERLWDIDRTIDVNARAQKTPVLITCEESQRLTMKNVYMKYDGNQPVIYGDKNLNPGSLKVLNTGAPFVGDKLYQLKTQIWNEALTYLGITNINYQKKERMITDEVVRAMGGTIASRYSRLNARRQACEQINKMFGLDISVGFRADYREMDDENILSGDTEDNEVITNIADLHTDMNDQAREIAEVNEKKGAEGTYTGAGILKNVKKGEDDKK